MRLPTALLLSVSLAACRRPLPPGLDRDLVNETIAYAEAIAPRCDQIVEHPCYTGPSWPDPADPSLPKVPGWAKLENDRRVRGLNAYCYSPKQRMGGTITCLSQTIEKPPNPNDDCKMQEATGWPTADVSNVGEFVTVTKGPCQTPWVVLQVVRRTTAGNDFVASVRVLPSAFLDAHPELTQAVRSPPSEP